MSVSTLKSSFRSLVESGSQSVDLLRGGDRAQSHGARTVRRTKCLGHESKGTGDEAGEDNADQHRQRQDQQTTEEDVASLFEEPFQTRFGRAREQNGAELLAIIVDGQGDKDAQIAATADGPGGRGGLVTLARTQGRCWAPSEGLPNFRQVAEASIHLRS